MSITIKRVSGSPSLNDVIDRAKELTTSRLGAKIGWLKKNTYPPYKSKKGKSSGGGITTAAVAAISEEGLPERHIPARPIFKPTIKREQLRLNQKLAEGMKDFINGKQSLEKVYSKIGLYGAGQIRKTITLIHSPPLKDSTVAARRRHYVNKTGTGNLRKPLVGIHKLLVNTPTYEVGNE